MFPRERKATPDPVALKVRPTGAALHQDSAIARFPSHRIMMPSKSIACRTSASILQRAFIVILFSIFVTIKSFALQLKNNAAADVVKFDVPYIDVPADTGKMEVFITDAKTLSGIGSTSVSHDSLSPRVGYNIGGVVRWQNSSFVLPSRQYGEPVINPIPARYYLDIFDSAFIINAYLYRYTIRVKLTPVPPKITAHPMNRTSPMGSAVTFGVTAEGPSLTYQWWKGRYLFGATAIGGAVGPTLTIPSVQAADADEYFVVVKNGGGEVTSRAATLTVTSAPVFIAHPESQAKTAGQSASFTVRVNGFPAPTLQWRKDGLNLPGAPGSTYTIPATNAGHAGTYTVVATNSHGTATSEAAVLTVAVKPVIVSHPSGLMRSPGESASFTVVAEGVPPPAFQWMKSGKPIPGATGSTFTIPAVSSSDSGSYSVSATNPSGVVTSNTAQLTITAPPYIVTHPQGLTRVRGQSAAFSVTAGGMGPYTFQWRKDGADIAGATGTGLVVPGVDEEDAGSYSVAVGNAWGTVTSNPAILVFDPSPTGELSVTLHPPQARMAGARWSADGGATWFASGETAPVKAGERTVTFSDAGGFEKPTPVNLVVTAGNRAEIEAVYTSVSSLVMTGRHIGRSYGVGWFHDITGGGWNRTVRSEYIDAKTPLQMAKGEFSSISAGNGFSIIIKQDGTAWFFGDVSTRAVGFTGTLADNLPYRTYETEDSISWQGMKLRLGDDIVDAFINEYSCRLTTFAGARGTYLAGNQYPWWGGSEVPTVHQGGIRNWAGSRWVLDASRSLWGRNRSQTSAIKLADHVNLVDGSSLHVLFTDDSGALWSGGINYYGQLGHGVPRNQWFDPVKIDTDVAAVATGAGHSLYLKTDGTLWGMGDNSQGQLGDGTNQQRILPVHLADGVVAIAAGYHHSLFVKEDRSLWGMGRNEYGQLGDGTTENRNFPVHMADFVDKIAAGTTHSLFTVSAALAAEPRLQVESDQGGVIAGNTGVARFGTSRVGSPLLRSYTLRNAGGSALVVTSLQAGGAFQVNAPALPLNLEAGQSVSFGVTFTPAAVGESSATLQIATDQPDSPRTVTLTGSGSPSILSVLDAEGSPLVSGGPAVDLGSLIPGAVKETEFRLRNDGSLPLHLGSLEWAQGGEDLQILSAGMTQLLEPGATTSFRIAFRPTEEGWKGSTLRIGLLEPGGEPDFLIQMESRGIPLAIEARTGQEGVLSATRGIGMGSVATGGSGGLKILSLHNLSAIPQNLEGLSVGGPNAGDFTLHTQTLPLPLSPEGTGLLAIGFSPRAAGDRVAWLTLPNPPHAPVLIPLRGTGMAPVAAFSQDFESRTTGEQITADLEGWEFHERDERPFSGISILENDAGEPGLQGRFAALSGEFGVAGVQIGGAGGLATLAFDFLEPEGEGGSGISFGYTDGASLNPAGPLAAAAFTLRDGLLEPQGVTTGPAVPYLPGRAYTLSLVLNPTDDPADYEAGGAGHVLAPRSVDLWLHDHVSGYLSRTSYPLGDGESAADTLVFRPLGEEAEGTVHIDAVTFYRAVAPLLVGRMLPALTLEDAAGGVLAGDGGTIDFGTVRPEQTLDRVYVLRNRGPEALAIGGFGVTGDQAADFEMEEPPAELAAGATATLHFSFSPQSPGPREATLTLQGGELEPLRIRLAGEGSTSPLVVEGPTGTALASGVSAIDLGTRNAPGGWGNATIITLKNQGSSTLSPQIQFVGPGAGSFSFDGALPLMISPGGSTQITLYFNPTATGTRDATMVINVGGEELPFEVTVTGTGVRPVMVLEDSDGIPLPDGTPIDFRSVPHGPQYPGGGPSVSKIFTVRNAGTGPLRIQQGINYTGGGSGFNGTAYFPTYSPTQPVIIPPGGSTLLVVSVGPARWAAETATLQLTSVSPFFSQSFPMSWGGVSSALVVERPTGSPVNWESQWGGAVDFGAVELGATATRSYTLRNSGASAVDITGIAVTGDHTGDFELDTSGMLMSLGAGQTTTFSLKFQPTAAGQRVAEVIFSGSPGPAYSIGFKGSGVAPALAVEQPAGNPLAESGATTRFGSVTTATAVYTIRNPGTAPLQIEGVTLSGQDAGAFVLDLAGMTPTVAPGHSTTFSVSFRPASPGERSALLSIDSDAAGPFQVALTGYGLVPVPVVEQPAGRPLASGISATDFGEIPTGAGSPPVFYTLRNTGNAPFELLEITTSGAEAEDFAVDQSGTAGLVLPGETTTFSVTFRPRAGGSRAATLSLEGDGGYEHVVPLSGIGTGSAIVVEGPGETPLADGGALPDFGTVERGDQSPLTTVTLRNPGTYPLLVSGIMVESGHSGDFVVDLPGMPLTLVPGGSMTFPVVFTPTGVGSRSSVLRILSNATAEDGFTVALTGTATSATLMVLEQPVGSPLASGVASVEFGELAEGTTGPAKIFTVRNAGVSNLQISEVSVAGQDAGDFPADSSGMDHSLAPGETTTFAVAFAPSSQGIRTATLEVAAEGTEPVQVNLRGTGTRAIISIEHPVGFPLGGGVSAVDFGNVPTGGPLVTQELTIRNLGTAPLQIGGGEVSGDFVFDVSDLPPVVEAGGTATFPVGFSSAEPGLKTGTLTISSNAVNQPEFSFDLIANGVDSAIRVEQPAGTPLENGNSTLDFGVVPVGTSAPKLFRITNSGVLPLEIGGLLTEGAHAADFVVDATGVDTLLEAGESTEFLIWFNPAAAGPRGATLSIATDAGVPFTAALEGSGQAIDAPVATHSAPGYRPGENTAIQVAIHFAGDEISALGYELQLPPGWSYVSDTSDAGVKPEPGQTGLLEWVWLAIPGEGTSFSVSVLAPEAASGFKSFTGAASLADLSGHQTRVDALPDPLELQHLPPPFHSADTGDSRINLSELLGVVSLYNHRAGGIRMGQYHRNGASYLPGPGAQAPPYHSTDLSADWHMSLGELLGTISLFNHRSGSTRTGEYHYDAVQSRFVPGPQGMALRGPRNGYVLKAGMTRPSTALHPLGGTLSLEIGLTYPASQTSALGVELSLPPGWSHLHSTGGAAISPAALQKGTLEWAWVVIPESPAVLSVTLAYPAGGTWEGLSGQAIALNSAGTEKVVSIALPGGFDDWVASEFGDDTSLDRSREGDPDHDGLPNLLEYALALSPLWVDGHPLDVSQVDNQVIVSYDRPEGGVEGIAYTLHCSTTLMTWEEAGEPQFVPLGEGRERMTLTLPPAAGGKKFFKLEVAESP